jgi:predicted metal-binding membrane protein
LPPDNRRIAVEQTMQLGLSDSLWGKATSWVSFFAVVLGGWAALFAMSADFATRAPVSLLGPGMGVLAPLFSGTSGDGVLPLALDVICFAGPSSGEAAPVALFGMWSLMALAMMAPTAAPMLRTYGDLAAGNPERVPPTGFWGLLAGFSVVWIGFAAIAALAQSAAAWAGLMTAGGLLRASWLAAALLALAGLYQFSTLKTACLSRCRSPMAFFLAHWREGVAGALRMGLQQGVACLGCCWALMALAFVGGTMNLVWMGGAMVLMTIEKLPTFGRYITAPLGAALLASAAAVAWRAATV